MSRPLAEGRGARCQSERGSARYALGTRYALMIAAAVSCGDPSRRLTKEEWQCVRE